MFRFKFGMGRAGYPGKLRIELRKKAAFDDNEADQAKVGGRTIGAAMAKAGAELGIGPDRKFTIPGN